MVLRLKKKDIDKLRGLQKVHALLVVLQENADAENPLLEVDASALLDVALMVVEQEIVKEEAAKAAALAESR